MAKTQCAAENLHFNYKELDIIGRGAYGEVHRARDNLTGSYVAIKKLRIALSDNGVSATALREISLLKQLNAYNHENIVKLLDVCQFLERDEKLLILLVFEYMEQDLSNLIADLPKIGMSPTKLQRLSRELLIGLDFLHANGIMHRDLKPQNLLISSKGVLKIAAFGLINTCRDQMRVTNAVATLWYRAPEILLDQGYNCAVNIWSAACIIFEMFSRKPLFPGTSQRSQLDRIFDLTGRPTEDLWPPDTSLTIDHFPPRSAKRPRDFCSELSKSADNLLSRMLSYELHLRPSAFTCLQHEYFQQQLV